MRRFASRIWHFFRPDRAEQAMSREIASHLTLLEDDFLKRGLSATEARRAARLALGGVEQIKDRHRDARSFIWLEDLRRDIVHAARLIRRNPLFALTAALSLAIGIGANTAIFTVTNALLLRDPVGVVDPARLVDIGIARPDGGLNPTSYPAFLDLRERATTLNGLYAQNMFAHAVGFTVAGSDAMERVYAQSVTTSYFNVLGATPAVGRLFDAHDSEQINASPVTVLSHAFWTRRFAANPAIVGQTIRINGQPLTVIGVAVEQFQGNSLSANDLWLPMTMTAASGGTPEALRSRGGTIQVGARLKAGATIEQAAAEIDAIGRALGREYPNAAGAERGLGLLASSRLPGNAGLLALFFTFLMALVTLVLIVACANLSAILLARSAARRREIAVRLAIGAGRGRLVRQLLTETILLFALGGFFGLFLARMILALTIPMLPALPFPVDVSLPLDLRVIAFTAIVSLIAALASGLAPALQASRADVLTSLNTDVQGPSRRSRMRHAFVIAQVACSLLLAVLAGLFVRALHQAGAVEPGYDPKGVELATVDLSMGHYTDVSGPRFSHDLLDRVRQIPGVQAATVASVLPGGFEEMRLSGLTTPGYEPADGEKIIFPAFFTVEPGYFATIRLPLVSGRDFADTDVAAAQKVIIVSENLARRFFPGQDAVGKYITPNPKFGPPLLVVGVARDLKSSSLIDGKTRPAVYVPMQQQYAKGWPQITIAARSTTGRRMPDELRDAVRALDPSLPIVRARTLEEEAAMGLVLPGIVASVAGTLGSIGMLLAAIGLYGVTAYTVARRSREIGIRIALGARAGHIATMVVAQGLWLAAIGSAIGLGLGALVGRALAGFLFGVPPLDPPAFIGAAVLFATIASIASYIPARRAIRVDPLTALRRD